MNVESLSCWRCGDSLADVLLPLSRRAECPACGADLHTCVLCRYYDRRITGQCAHDQAEAVEIKDRANFCDYFRPNPNLHRGQDAQGSPSSVEAASKAPLNALFDPPPNADPAADPHPVRTTSTGEWVGSLQPGSEGEGEKARRDLNALFGSGPAPAPPWETDGSDEV